MLREPQHYKLEYRAEALEAHKQIFHFLFVFSLNYFIFADMNQPVIAFRIAPLAPALGNTEDMYCGKKTCCKKFKKGKRCKKCPGREKIS